LKTIPLLAARRGTSPSRPNNKEHPRDFVKFLGLKADQCSLATWNFNENDMNVTRKAKKADRFALYQIPSMPAFLADFSDFKKK